MSDLNGVISRDPASDLPVGVSLNFAPISIALEFEGTTNWIRNWEFFEGLLLSLSVKMEKSVAVEGSAVLVAPGIALCATHVLHDYLHLLQSGRASLYCHGIATHGVEIWKGRKVTCVANTDVTILGLECASALPPSMTFHQSVITTRLPSNGEVLTVCGFRYNNSSLTEKGAEFGGNLWVSRGTVLEYFPVGRDRVMLPWPTLSVSCPSFGGMSGGPVFYRHGLLVGLLSSSIDTGDGVWLSYVSLLWPVLTIPFEATWPAGMHQDHSSLLGLDERLCAIDRRSAVVIDASGTEALTLYRPWSEVTDARL
jgi:hypothetical protein